MKTKKLFFNLIRFVSSPKIYHVISKTNKKTYDAWDCSNHHKAKILIIFGNI